MHKRLRRSRDRKIAGVCGGIAEYLGIDPTIVRLIWLIALLLYGTGFWAYVICWIVIPE
ncbi:MAG: PspC domain-containing protein [Firmicutes bacterium]|jgi:phage shock protein C|nr:PspC domain-containing protein [Bacillota bacterium]